MNNLKEKHRRLHPLIHRRQFKQVKERERNSGVSEKDIYLLPPLNVELWMHSSTFEHKRSRKGLVFFQSTVHGSTCAWRSGQVIVIRTIVPTLNWCMLLPVLPLVRPIFIALLISMRQISAALLWCCARCQLSSPSSRTYRFQLCCRPLYVGIEQQAVCAHSSIVRTPARPYRHRLVFFFLFSFFVFLFFPSAFSETAELKQQQATNKRSCL